MKDPVARSGRPAYRRHMPGIKDLTGLGKLIASRSGWPAAKAFKSYRMSDADRATMTLSAVELLRIFPDAADAGAQLSAALAVQLERALAAPVQLIAGTLSVEGQAVLSDPSPPEAQAIVSTCELAWGGHVWVMVGPYIADIALFRAAYSSDGPAALSRHINLVFGPDKALYVDEWRQSRKVGLGYEAHYIFGEDEVTALMGGAYRRIKAKTP